MKILGRYPSLRLRRNRKFTWVRRLVEENNISVNDLILPIFVTEGKNKVQEIIGELKGGIAKGEFRERLAKLLSD